MWKLPIKTCFDQTTEPGPLKKMVLVHCMQTVVVLSCESKQIKQDFDSSYVILAQFQVCDNAISMEYVESIDI